VKVIDLATRAFFLYGGEPECVSATVTSAAPGAPGKQFSAPFLQIRQAVMIFHHFSVGFCLSAALIKKI